MNPERTYTTKQIAELLNLSEYTVRRYLKEGKIKGFRPGKGWRVTKSELDKFLKGGKSSDGD